LAIGECGLLIRDDPTCVVEVIRDQQSALADRQLALRGRGPRENRPRFVTFIENVAPYRYF
jgi:hypothetical protein